MKILGGVLDYTFYMKTIETHARAFLPLNTSAVGGSVRCHSSPVNRTTVAQLFWCTCWSISDGNVYILAKAVCYKNSYCQSQI